MADTTVMQTLYAREFTTAYEQKMSFLRGCVTIEGEVHGDNFIFIIEGLADEAKERGANGAIPYANDDQNPVTCTMKEYHFLARKNRFRIFSSSVPQRLSMARRGVVSCNFKTDKLIINELATTTYSTNGGSAGVNKDISLMGEAAAKLDAAYVPDDGERYGILTPMAYQQALRIQQFTSWDYVGEGDKPYMKAVQWRMWNGIKWARHPNLPGKGTATASCFVFHKSAIGHALNQGEMMSKIGENDEQDYSWARTSTYQGSKAVQLAGIIKIVHNDTTALNA